MEYLILEWVLNPLFTKYLIWYIKESGKFRCFFIRLIGEIVIDSQSSGAGPGGRGNIPPPPRQIQGGA